MKEIGLYEAKTKLSALIAELEATGEPVFLTRHGRIVAEIRSHTGQVAPKRGCLKSKDFFLSADFDEVEVGFEGLFGQDSLKVAEDEVPYRF